MHLEQIKRFIRVKIFNVIFNNISVISCPTVLFEKVTEKPIERREINK